MANAKLRSVRNIRDRLRHFAECKSHSSFRFNMSNGRMSLQRLRLGEHFDHHIRPFRKWILHLHVASVQIEIARLRGGKGVFCFVDDFGQRRKKISGRVTALRFRRAFSLEGKV